jgi:hypothetical protein
MPLSLNAESHYSYGRVAALLVFVCVGILACYWSSRRLYATILFAQDSPGAVAQAVGLTPGAASYHARLAQLQPARASAEYETALRLNPRDSNRRIEMSVLQEVNGDDAAAEASLIQAVRYSRYYLPKFSLAAFYFRHENAPEFRDWARQALMVSSSDPHPIFQMAQRLGSSNRDIASQVVPDRAPVLSAWLEFLLDGRAVSQQSTEIRTAAERLIAAGSTVDGRAVLRACDELLNAGDIEDSRTLWDGLAGRHWIPYGPLGRTGRDPVTNDSFAYEPLAHGFDWKLNNGPGIATSRAGGLGIEFNGKEPEHMLLASQTLALLPSRRYHLTVRYRTQGIAPGAGLRCRVIAYGADAKPLMDALDLSGSSHSGQPVTFETPPKPQPLTLTLSYDRELGTAKIEGFLIVEKVQIELLAR